jgi:hypothetical protein
MNAVIFKESATSVLGSKMESSSKLNVMISGATGTENKLNIVTMKRKTDRIGFCTGNIGKYIAEKFKDRYNLTLMLHSEKKKKEVEQFGKVVVSELSDLAKLQSLFKGIDVLVHLAGMSSPSTEWKDVCTFKFQKLPSNMTRKLN